MAGEKTKAKSRVVKKDDEIKSEQNIVMTPAQFQEFVQETMKTALSQTKGVSEQGKAQLNANVNSTLTTKINKRVKDGQRFFEHLANPKGPRKRLVIDKIYREFTGSSISSTINGSTVKVPVDGKAHWVHPAHYAAIKSKLQYISSVRDRASEGPEFFGDDVGDYRQVRQ